MVVASGTIYEGMEKFSIPIRSNCITLTPTSEMPHHMFNYT